MPKIKISGIDIDKYKSNTSIEDFYYSIESIESPFETKPLPDVFIVSNEGIVGAAFKGAATATRMGVGAVREGKQMLRSAARMVKSQWRTLYPKLLQGFQKMGQNLKNMWARLMKYDKRFLELGENMRELTELGGAQQINRMGNITIKVYPIDWGGVKQSLDYIRSWDNFVKTMAGIDPSTGKVVGNANQHQGTGTTISQNLRDAANNVETGTRIVGVDELGSSLNTVKDRDERLAIIAGATRTNNLILARYNGSTAIMKMIYQGRETHFTKTINRLKRADKNATDAFKNLFTGKIISSAGNVFGFIKNTAVLPLSMVGDATANIFGLNEKQKMKRLAGSGSTSAKIVQTILTGFTPEEITFRGNERDRFVAWIEGNGNDDCRDYCSMCANLLGKGTEGGSLLSKAIRTGGESCKSSVDKTLKKLKRAMDYLYKIAEQNDKNYGETLNNNNSNGNNNNNQDNNMGNGAGGSSVDFSNTENDNNTNNNQNNNNDEDTPAYRTEVDALNAYIGSYQNILGTLADNYQGFVQGLLMTAYTIVEDGESIVSVVNQCRGGDPRKKGANINAEDQ